MCTLEKPVYCRTLEKGLGENKNVKKHDTTMGLQSTPGPTNTRWCGRLPRQEKGKRTTGEEVCWKPCTSANSSTPPTRTVVWPVILPGYHCLTNPHPLDKFNHLGELIVSNYVAVSINNNNQFVYTELLVMMTTAC